MTAVLSENAAEKNAIVATDRFMGLLLRFCFSRRKPSRSSIAEIGRSGYAISSKEFMRRRASQSGICRELARTGKDA